MNFKSTKIWHFSPPRKSQEDSFINKWECGGGYVYKSSKPENKSFGNIKAKKKLLLEK